MKVVVLQDYLRCGGTELNSIFLVNKLNQYQIPTQLITFRPGGSVAHKIDPQYHQSLQKIDFKLDLYAPQLSKVLSQINPNCIICMGTVANSFGEYLKYRFKDKKIITTVRTGKKISFFYKRSLNASDLIICNSRWAKEQLLQQGTSEQKVKVIYNPLLLNKGNKGTIPNCYLREYCHANKAAIIFLCVQNFRKSKRHEELINYFAQLDLNSNWQLWLVGEGEQLKKCEYLVSKLNLQKRIFFFGYQADPRPFYEEADIAISLSQEESLPNFLLEAQQWGLPIIALDAGGVKETFIDKESGFLINKYNQKELLERCNYFIHNFTKIGIFGKKAIRYCNKDFSEEKWAKNFIHSIKT